MSGMCCDSLESGEIGILETTAKKFFGSIGSVPMPLGHPDPAGSVVICTDLPQQEKKNTMGASNLFKYGECCSRFSTWYLLTVVVGGVL
jgi:hypothetical protein